MDGINRWKLVARKGLVLDFRGIWKRGAKRGLDGERERGRGGVRSRVRRSVRREVEERSGEGTRCMLNISGGTDGGWRGAVRRGVCLRHLAWNSHLR